MKGKDLRIAVLFDFYGEMLTEKQKDVVDLYYNQDLSLAEIAEHEGITRQGVRDNIKRGEAFMLEMEEKLHLAQKITGLLEAVETVGRLCREIEAENRSVHSAGIAKRAEAISRLLEKCVNDYFDTSEEP